MNSLTACKVCAILGNSRFLSGDDEDGNELEEMSGIELEFQDLTRQSIKRKPVSQTLDEIGVKRLRPFY